MAVDFSDIRALVTGGNVKPLEEAIYIDRLGGWFNIRELMANEKSQVMQEAVNQKTGQVNLDVLNAGIAVRSLRYPAPGVLPRVALNPDRPADNASDDDKAKYEQAVKAYQAQLAVWERYKQSYPGYTDANGNVVAFPHPKGGEVIFPLIERDLVSQNLPGAILEEIVAPAMVLSGFNKDELAELKKKSSATTDTSSTSTL